MKVPEATNDEKTKGVLIIKDKATLSRSKPEKNANVRSKLSLLPPLLFPFLCSSILEIAPSPLLLEARNV